VSELCIVGKPVIFIPPNVAEDHQTKNALLLIKKALLLKESELNQSLALFLKRY
jgi:UDP-N-acetylglucosamine--N-acetylmuramyl-(pentapeptide) pyrophosphoryl-undecaprenol N-acetylglucosamine transferase